MYAQDTPSQADSFGGYNLHHESLNSCETSLVKCQVTPAQVSLALVGFLGILNLGQHQTISRAT